MVALGCIHCLIDSVQELPGVPPGLPLGYAEAGCDRADSVGDKGSSVTEQFDDALGGKLGAWCVGRGQ